MEIRQIKGNTWVLEDRQLIPLYKTDEHHCILLDTGWTYQRSAIEKALRENELEPVGILGSHAHTDHSGNHRYFQENYGIPVALSYGEAALCYSPLAMKAYFPTFSSKTLREDAWFSGMEVRADQIIGLDDSVIDFCGAHFDILHTLGHSPDHISIGTPDHVLYLGDVCLSKDEIEAAKLPYFFSIDAAIQTMKAIRGASFDKYIIAHRAVDESLDIHIDANIEALHRTSEAIRNLIVQPMTFDQIQAAVCRAFSLKSSNPVRAALFARNIRSYIDYLTDHGEISSFAKNGMGYYEKV